MRLTVKARRDDLPGSPPSSNDSSRPEETVSMDVLDFSLGGMRGRAGLALRPEEQVTVFVPPFGTRPNMDVTGRVVRCHRQEGRFDVGIEFCQTRREPESSPWVRIHELFYMAGESKKADE